MSRSRKEAEDIILRKNQIQIRMYEWKQEAKDIILSRNQKA
jgi:hypothetical protein